MRLWRSREKSETFAAETNLPSAVVFRRAEKQQHIPMSMCMCTKKNSKDINLLMFDRSDTLAWRNSRHLHYPSTSYTKGETQRVVAHVMKRNLFWGVHTAGWILHSVHIHTNMKQQCLNASSVGRHSATFQSPSILSGVRTPH